MLMKTVWGAGRKCQLLEQNPEKKNTYTVIGNVLGSVLKHWKNPYSKSFQSFCLSCVAFRKRMKTFSLEQSY